MMRSFRPPLALLFTGALLVTVCGFGCSTGAQPDDTEFRVATVDSIRASFSSTSDTLQVHLRGTVGPNGCYTLDRLDGQRSSGQLTLTPVVKHRTSGACTMAIVPLEATYEVAPPFSGESFEIVVPQPEGEDLTTTVQIPANLLEVR